MTFGRKVPPIVPEVAAKLQQMAKPVRRPLVDALYAQVSRKQVELEQAEEHVARLIGELRSLRHEAVWVEVNPEFDAIYERLSQSNDQKAP